MTSTNPHLKRDKSLFFNHGNVIIAAAPSNNEEGLLFRVNNLVLVDLSPVLAELFTLVNPTPETNELYEGVPVISMYDKAQDVRDLLRVIYDPPSFVLHRFDPETPMKLRGVLTLAKKYEIMSLWTRLVDHLKGDWPQTLADWDALETEINARQGGGCESAEDDRYVDDIFPEPGSAIYLARQLGIPDILPAAFYHLSRLEISYDRSLLEGDFDDSDVKTYKADGGRTADWSYLSGEDLKCLLLGRERIQRLVLSEARTFQTRECKENKKCGGNALPNYDALANSTDVLKDLKKLIPGDATEEDICGLCCSEVNADAEHLRAKVWDNLGEFFKIPSSPSWRQKVLV